MAHLAESQAAQFLSDVIEQLLAAIDPVQTSLEQRTAYNVEAAGATAEVTKGLADERAAVRVIGAVVKRMARKNPKLLAEWRASRRVKQKTGVVSRVVTKVLYNFERQPRGSGCRSGLGERYCPGAALPTPTKVSAIS